MAGLRQAGSDLFFKGGLFNGNRHLAAFSAEGVELSGNAYVRRLAVLADWSASGRDYRNNKTLDFADPTMAWLAITHWGMYDAATGGNLLVDFELGAATLAPAAGAEVGFDANTIGWGFIGATTVAGSHKGANEGLVSGTRYLTLHSAEPNDDGSNVIDQPVQVTAGQWTVDTSGTNRRARNNARLSFGAAVTDLPTPTWVALRDGNVYNNATPANNSRVLWKDQFDTAAMDPDLGDTLSFPVNTLSILVAIDT